MIGIYALKIFGNFVEDLVLKHFNHIPAQPELIEVPLGENGMYLHGLPNFIAPDTQRHVAAI